jgi:hypothetical protein
VSDGIDNKPLTESGTATARFGAPQNHLNVSVNAENINFNDSSLGALERISANSPQLGSELVSAARYANKQDTIRYSVGAIATACVAIAMLACTTVVMVFAGVGAGIALFLVCAVVAALFGVVFTGTAPDWLAKLYKPAALDDGKTPTE